MERGKRVTIGAYDDPIILDKYASVTFLANMEFVDQWVAAGKKRPGNIGRFLDTPENRKKYGYTGFSFKDCTPRGDNQSYFIQTFNDTKEEHRDYEEHGVAFIYNRILENFGKEQAEKYIAESRNVLFAVKEYGVDPRKYLEEKK